MIHLLCHLVDELDLRGLLATRWMYPMERYTKIIKAYVCNIARFKRSMVEGQIIDECIGFIIKYLQRFEVI